MTDDTSEQARAAELRDKLADELIAAGHVTSAPVEAAFRMVPRHAFVPADTPLEVTYAADNAVVAKRDEHGIAISSVSAAYIQVAVIEQAELRPLPRTVAPVDQPSAQRGRTGLVRARRRFRPGRRDPSSALRRPCRGHGGTGTESTHFFCRCLNRPTARCSRALWRSLNPGSPRMRWPVGGSVTRRRGDASIADSAPYSPTY